jgi:hypothetical protein
VIVYLRSLSDEPLPLPEVELPAAPDAEIPASETPVEETLPTEAPIGTLQSDDEPTTLYIE